MDEVAKFNRRVLRALSPKYLGVIVFVAFLALMLFLVCAVCLQVVGCEEGANLCCTFGGWALGILLASFTGLRVSRELALREWWRLREYEADPAQAEAKRMVYRLIGKPEGWWQEPNVDRYKEVRNRRSKLWGKKKKQLYDARRRLSHFWGNVVELVERGVLDSEEVWSAVGDPEIMYLLEALEVILAAEMKGIGELVKRCRLFYGGSFRPHPRVTRIIGHVR
jgi:hypothetical protein